MNLRIFAIILVFVGICFGAQAIHAQDVDGGDLYLVRSLFLDKIGGSLQSTRFRSLLRKKLAANGFEITHEIGKADAVLKGSLSVYVQKKWGDRFLVTEVALHLRSKRGKELWYGSYSTGHNLSLGRKDFVQELTDDAAKSLKKAREGSLSASRDGRVKHVFLVWKPDDTPLVLGESPKSVTQEELSKLKALGLKGQLKVAHTGIGGSGPSKTRVLIVMHQQLADGPVEFSLSGQSVMLVVQMGDTWLTEPSPLPFSKSKLRIVPITINETGVTLDRENSGIQFQFALKWSKE